MKITSHPRSIQLMYFLCATLATTIFLVGCVGVPARTGQIYVPNAGLGQPGYYGGRGTRSYPQPQVIYRQPIIVNRGAGVQRPIYTQVPSKHYSKKHRNDNHDNNRGHGHDHWVRSASFIYMNTEISRFPQLAAPTVFGVSGLVRSSRGQLENRLTIWFFS